MKKGFTLIELLVSVLIIGILSGIAIPNYIRSIERTRSTEAMEMIKSLNDSVYAYAAANGTCPATFKKLLVDVPGTMNNDRTQVTSNGFIYHLNKATNSPIPGTSCGGVVAERENRGYLLWNPYKIVNQTTKARTMACTATTADAIKLCEGFGVYTTSKPY